MFLGDPRAGAEPQERHQRVYETEGRYGVELHAERQRTLDLGVRQMAMKTPALLLTSMGLALSSFYVSAEPHSHFLACKIGGAVTHGSGSNVIMSLECLARGRGPTDVISFSGPPGQGLESEPGLHRSLS